MAEMRVIKRFFSGVPNTTPPSPRKAITLRRPAVLVHRGPVLDIVYAIVLVGVLIFVHELGHFAWAKFFGVKVLTFSLGFGPKLFSFQRGETEYRVGMLP